MPRPRTIALALLVGSTLASTALAGDGAAARAKNGDGFTLATLSYQPAWCAPEMDPLTPDVCHVPGTPTPDGRRTLVVFLHGVIGKNTMWQWLQERGIGRSAKQFHFDAIVPQAPRVGPGGAGGFAWPGLGRSKGVDEDALLEQWSSARHMLEERNGHPFDEVFVVGFSSGAYFATSLALRAKLDVDGYVLLAGGSPGATTVEGDARAPVFIGVCGNDHASAPEARELGQLLSARGWPTRVDEQPVGHGVSDVHMAHALSWLRARRDRAQHAQL